jgi:hypothetical protein
VLYEGERCLGGGMIEAADFALRPEVEDTEGRPPPDCDTRVAADSAAPQL